jgi:hypothetical protein
MSDEIAKCGHKKFRYDSILACLDCLAAKDAELARLRGVVEAARIQFKAMAWSFHDKPGLQGNHEGRLSECSSAVCDENRKILNSLIVLAAPHSAAEAGEKVQPAPWKCEACGRLCESDRAWCASCCELRREQCGCHLKPFYHKPMPDCIPGRPAAPSDAKAGEPCKGCRGEDVYPECPLCGQAPDVKAGERA